MVQVMEQIQIDRNIKEQVAPLLSELGLDVSGAAFFCISVFFAAACLLRLSCRVSARRRLRQWRKQGAFPVILMSKATRPWKN